MPLLVNTMGEGETKMAGKSGLTVIENPVEPALVIRLKFCAPKGAATPAVKLNDTEFLPDWTLPTARLELGEMTRAPSNAEPDSVTAAVWPCRSVLGTMPVMVGLVVCVEVMVANRFPTGS